MFDTPTTRPDNMTFWPATVKVLIVPMMIFQLSVSLTKAWQQICILMRRVTEAYIEPSALCPAYMIWVVRLLIWIRGRSWSYMAQAGWQGYAGSPVPILRLSFSQLIASAWGVEPWERGFQRQLTHSFQSPTNQSICLHFKGIISGISKMSYRMYSGVPIKMSFSNSQWENFSFANFESLPRAQKLVFYHETFTKKLSSS